MLEDDRKWLNKDGWEVINYSGNSKHRGLYESTENWESEREPWHHFLSFNKADSEKKLIVDFRRKEYLNPGYYHIESITQADSRGATINVMKGDSLICNMDIPKEDHEELGNMASMSYESFMRTAFASPTFTCEQWANHTYEEAKRWSYTRSDTFYSSGGDITMRILSGVKETSPNEFSIYDIKIVEDSIP